MNPFVLFWRWFCDQVVYPVIELFSRDEDNDAPTQPPGPERG